MEPIVLVELPRFGVLGTGAVQRVEVQARRTGLEELAGETLSPSMTAVLSNVRSWSTNWPRYVNPAGIREATPAPWAIALPSFFRTASPSWRPVPRGPIRENRNGGAWSSAAAASEGSRPPTLSVRSPSPRTK
jgi:hypothetical protein